MDSQIRWVHKIKMLIKFVAKPLPLVHKRKWSGTWLKWYGANATVPRIPLIQKKKKNKTILVFHLIQSIPIRLFWWLPLSFIRFSSMGIVYVCICPHTRICYMLYINININILCTMPFDNWSLLGYHSSVGAFFAIYEYAKEIQETL